MGMAWLTVLNSLLAAALLPLVAGIVLFLWGRRMGRRGQWAGVVGVTFAVAAFGLALGALVQWVAKDGFNQPNYVEAFTYRWVQLPAAPAAAGGLTTPAPPAAVAPRASDGLTIGCLIDSLTIVMFMVFTLLNVLVQVFALGSLADDAHKPRMFALLGLLNFAVLGLLLANSLAQMLIFGEFLSLAAFFLLRLGVPGKAAGLRMYLMQAAGSAAFLLGLGILVLHSGSLAGLAFFDDRGASILSASVRQASNVQSSEFLVMPGGEGFLQMHWLTWAGICFLVAALARLAQFPFQTWLHDAAEAPAAVTALVTAAMLMAGVCLLARVYPILTLDARLIAAVVGCVTLMAGAGVALVQTDLRKILAWSTVSQGGYVLLFLGAGGYQAGILQLFTHGFAKTGLFLAAGTVMHGLGTADLRQMGGLWKRFPITAVGSLLAVLALGGAPWFSGAYSTNLGLACVYDYAHALQAVGGRHYQLLLYYLPAAFTYITALGMGRWWWLTFAGTSRNAKLYEAAHEAPFLTLPIIILTGFYAGWSYDFAGLLPLIGKSIPTILLPHAGAPALVLTGSDVALAIVIRDTGWAFLGLATAAFVYMDGLAFADRLRRLPVVKVVDYWLRERMFFDELYEGLLLPAVLLAARLTGVLERLGRMVMKLAARVLALGMALAARAEHSHQHASPPPERGEDEPGQDGERAEG